MSLSNKSSKIRITKAYTKYTFLFIDAKKSYFKPAIFEWR